MHSVKNSVFASPQWAGALLLSLLTAVKLWFGGIWANSINQHLLTLSSPKHNIPSPWSNSAFFIMQFLFLIPALLRGHWTHLLQGQFLDTWSMAGNFFSVSISPFFTEEHCVKLGLNLWLQVVVLWLKHKTHIFLQGLLTPSIASWLLQERFPPRSQWNIKPFFPLFLLIIPSKTTHRAAQEQQDG